MASQVVHNQLARTINLNAQGVAPHPPAPIPPQMANPPQQIAFPPYQLGYLAVANPAPVVQQILPRPANGGWSAHPFHMLSESNLHPILFQMDPHPGAFSNAGVPALINQQTGLPELDDAGAPLLYFSHLPRWIAHDVSGFYMELWTRLDPRVRMRDIKQRINPRPGRDIPQQNTFNMRRIRARDCINASAWFTGRQDATPADVHYLNVQTRQQLLLNTCMVVDLANNRLLKPILSLDRIIIGYINSNLPVDHFLAGFPTPFPIPSERMIIVIELRKRLQRLAMALNLGNAPNNYEHLTIQHEPNWFHHGGGVDRTITELDNRTHRQWLAEIYQWYPGTSRDGVQRQNPQRLAAAAYPAQVPFAAATAVAPPQPLVLAPTTAPAAAPNPAPARHTMNPIDPRLMGPNAGAGVPLVLPQHYANSNGGVSYYVEPAHQQGRRQL